MVDWRDVYWVDRKAASTDALSAVLMEAMWVGQLDASTAAYSAAHSAVCWVASTAVLWVAQLEER